MSTLKINNISPYSFPLPVVKGFNDLETITPISENTQFQLTKFTRNDLFRFYVRHEDDNVVEVEPAFLTDTEFELDTAIDENDKLFVFALKTTQFRSFDIDSVTIFHDSLSSEQSTTTVSFTIPQEVQSGDLIVLNVTHTESISADNNTLRISEHITTNGNVSLSLFRKIATASSAGQNININNPDSGTVQIHAYVLRAKRDIDIHDFEGRNKDDSPFSLLSVTGNKLDLVIAALATSSTTFVQGSEIEPPNLFTKTSGATRLGVGHYYPTTTNEDVDGSFTVPLDDTDEQHCSINTAISFGLVDHEDGSLTLVMYDIFAVTDAGTIYKIDPTDGSVSWENTDLSADTGTNFDIDAKPDFVTVSTYDNFIILNSADGTVVDTVTDADLNASIAYGLNDMIYVGKSTGDVDKYDVSQQTVTDTFTPVTSAIVDIDLDSDENIYVTTGDETVSIDGTGTQRFAIDETATDRQVTSIALSETATLLQCLDDRTVNAYDSSDGTQIWNIKFHSDNGTAGVAVFCDRRYAYVVTNVGKLLRFDLDDGTQTDTLTIGNQVTEVDGQTPVSGYIGKNEHIYVGYGSGHIVEVDADKNATLVLDTTESNVHVAVESGNIGPGFWNI